MHDLPDATRLAQTASTNTYLVELWQRHPDRLHPFHTVVTDFQEAGRGRLGREWVAPAGTSMLTSILVPVNEQTASLLPLMAGLVVREQLECLLPESDVQLKWPNDVLVGGKKICGILCESLSPSDAVVGIGINLSQSADQLPPVPSTSVTIEGGPAVDATLLALSCAVGLQDLLAADTAQIHAEIESGCSTLGNRVRVELPSGQAIEGTAISLEADGALLVEDGVGEAHIVHAGDITHLHTSPLAVNPGGTL